MIFRQSVRLLTLAFGALGLCISLPALATHSGTTTVTSSGTSKCLTGSCSTVDWTIETGDLDVEYEGAPANWLGVVLLRSRVNPNTGAVQTMTGKVCDDDGTSNCDTAEFRISDSLRCTGYALVGCSKFGRFDSDKKFTQQCGTQTQEGRADCVGQIQAVTDGPNGRIHVGDVVNIGGAAEAALNNDCNAVFPNDKQAGLSTKQMGEIIQRHFGSTNCNAENAENVVDVSQKQRACNSTPFGPDNSPSCYRNGVATPAGIRINQDFVNVAAGQCFPGTVQDQCSPQNDQGKFRVVVTKEALLAAGVSANDVDPAQFKCGDLKTGIAPEKVTSGDPDLDGNIDFWDIQCKTCNTAAVPPVFFCSGGQCEAVGSDGAQPFAAVCFVDLN
jgi:hypothetical protein